MDTNLEANNGTHRTDEEVSCFVEANNGGDSVYKVLAKGVIRGGGVQSDINGKGVLFVY